MFFTELVRTVEMSHSRVSRFRIRGKERSSYKGASLSSMKSVSCLCYRQNLRLYTLYMGVLWVNIVQIIPVCSQMSVWVGIKDQSMNITIYFLHSSFGQFPKMSQINSFQTGNNRFSPREKTLIWCKKWKYCLP